MLCPGSLNAEKDLPEQTSVYAQVGTMLHERTALYIEYLNTRKDKKLPWHAGLFEDDKNAVQEAGDYFNKLKDVEDTVVLYEAHEKKYSLSFIYPDMKGTVDSVLLLRNIKTKELFLHVIDYKFGKGVVVDAFENYQLIMYAMAALGDVEINSKVTGKLHINLHIVQPYIRNSNWELTDTELLKVMGFSAREKYKKMTSLCYEPDAPRIASKKACQFCKAKSTCPALAKFVPDIKTNLGKLSDEQIATIYDNKDLITMYLKSVEEHIKSKLEQGSFMNYTLKPKLSNRKWNDDAYDYLVENLSEEAFEVSSKLIGITKAEKLLGKEVVNKLTVREEGANEIVKILNKFENLNND
jgi:hypothetical protein